jgi:hypothetical protein
MMRWTSRNYGAQMYHAIVLRRINCKIWKQESLNISKSKDIILGTNQYTFISSTTASFSTASFSTTTTPNNTNQSQSHENKEKTKKDEKSNLFLDNLGSIFLLSIAGVVLTLIRASFGSTNKNKVREKLEEDSTLDPLEIDDLRVANSEFTPEVFQSIMVQLNDEYPQGQATYMNFVTSTRRIMQSLRGDAFTIELGHLLDRVVMAAVPVIMKSKSLKDGIMDDDASKNAKDFCHSQEISLRFFLTALSLAMDIDASVNERIRTLYRVLQLHNPIVTAEDVEEMVGYLQSTCQLPPETQIIASDNKIPAQEYKVASPHELVSWDGLVVSSSSNDENVGDCIDVQAFSDILRSKSVCAWGECYFKRKPKI